jgi:hypothetical protein|tara:strand:+ start:252 stop:428 length:177 start_codon:yes stop_codon:yes gene_type:complete
VKKNEQGKEVPPVLVKTWYELIKNGPDNETRNHAQKMLLGAFGSHQELEKYLKKHGLV